MKSHLRTLRIAQKTNPPLVPPYDDKDTCFVWLGTTMGGTYYNRLRRAPVTNKPRAIINRSDSVNRGLMEILDPTLLHSRYRVTQSCRTELCVNPHHWVATREPVYASEPIPALAPSNEWTREDAQELIDMYIVNHTRLLDLTHNLLMDIPPALIRSMGYEIAPPR